MKPLKKPGLSDIPGWKMALYTGLVAWSGAVMSNIFEWIWEVYKLPK